jgi:hypothetical protein
MIQVLKLVTGEELVAEVTCNPDCMVLKNPVRFVVTHEGAGLAPLSPFAKSKEIKILNTHIVWNDEVEGEVANAYNAQFGSGIVLAGANPNLKLV